MHAFIRKLHLIYHFTDINENEINPDQSLLKPKSTWTPPFTKSREFENLIRNTSNISFYNTLKQDNIINLHKDLNDVISLTTRMKMIIMRAHKESVVTIMCPEFCWNMRKKPLSIMEYYDKVMCNPKTILQEKVDDFIRKYKVFLADKDHEYSKSYNYQIANSYMLLKLLNSQQLNEIIAQIPLEYIQISKILNIER